MITFNKPFVAGKELFYIAKAVVQYRKLSGNGEFGNLCQTWLEDNLSCQKVLLTHSCTAALEMTAILSDIKFGDEVIMPSFTFVSTANAFVLRGGVPVFVDIRPDSLNIDENLIEEAITDRTKAIVAVHYAGGPCNMGKIMEIADRYGLIVIEDAAQAFYSTYNGQCLGTIAHFGAMSFHETKNIISGEGGALLINDSKFIERAEVLWEKGTNRKQFFRNEVDKYTWVDIGSSYLPSEIVSAFLYAQLEQSEQIIKKRTVLCNLYQELLSPLELKGHVQLPWIDDKGTANGHIFYIITESLEERTELITFLTQKQISAVFHYVPLHTSPAGVKYGRYNRELVNTDDLSERVLRLPLYYEMEEEQVCEVVESILEFYAK